MAKQGQMLQGQIRVGIGGWTYEPWRNNFYPEKLAHSRELEYAGSKLTAIEINATYHGTQKPSSFAKWRDETPEGFVFSVKASRFATNRKLLAEGRDSVNALHRQRHLATRREARADRLAVHADQALRAG